MECTARMTGKATGRSRRREHAWLRQHTQEYVGQWVALYGDDLLASGGTLFEVRNQLRAMGMLGLALLHFIPEADGP